MRIRVLAALLIVPVLLVSCRGGPGPDGTAPTTGHGAVSSPSAGDIAYGPASDQRLKVLLPSAPTVGVILWLHGGGWCCGDMSDVDPAIMDARAAGWAVVSVDYRRTPEFHVDQLAADVDRAVRFVRSRLPEWGLDGGPLVLGGASAGGHLALLHATAADQFVDPDLPADLRAVDARVDGVISFVGPSDLGPYVDRSITTEGFNAPLLVDQLLGCSDAGTVDPMTDRRYPSCGATTVQRGSPSYWATIAIATGSLLPPVLLVYGGRDPFVPPSSQAEPIARTWERAAGSPLVELDIPAQGGHAISADVDRAVLDRWLTAVATP